MAIGISSPRAGYQFRWVCPDRCVLTPTFVPRDLMVREKPMNGSSSWGAAGAGRRPCPVIATQPADVRFWSLMSRAVISRAPRP